LVPGDFSSKTGFRLTLFCDFCLNETLNSVKLISPAGSLLCFDYMTEPVPSTYAAEPFQFWIETEKVEVFLAERGYKVVEHLTAQEIEKKYLTLSDGSSAGKTLPFFGFIQAELR
jgi:hypothetical protein